MRGLLLLGLLATVAAAEQPKASKATVATGLYGLDISNAQCQLFTREHWSCFRKRGYSFAVIEVWRGSSYLSDATAACVRDALNSNFTRADLYAFMCPRCGVRSRDPRAVVRSIVSYARENISASWDGVLWLDVEQCTDCWFTNLNENSIYLSEAAEECKSLGVRVGVYSSIGEYPQVVGSSTNFSKNGLPLWYAHYSRPPSPSFSDSWAYKVFKKYAIATVYLVLVIAFSELTCRFLRGFPQFGGWQKPLLKQYSGNQALGDNDCGAPGIDSNWSPSY
jgi:Glycosyl hydrolases family 25